MCGERLPFWEGLRSDFWESFRSITFCLHQQQHSHPLTSCLLCVWVHSRFQAKESWEPRFCWGLKPSFRCDGGRQDQGPDCRARKQSVLQGAAECTEPEASAGSGSVGGCCRPGFVAGRVGSDRHHHHGAARHTCVAVLQPHSGAASYPGCLCCFGPAGLRCLRCQCLLGYLVDLQLLQGPSPRRLRPGLLLLPTPPQQFHRLLKISLRHPPRLVYGLSQCRSTSVIGIGFFGPTLPKFEVGVRKKTLSCCWVCLWRICVWMWNWNLLMQWSCNVGCILGSQWWFCRYFSLECLLISLDDES